MPWFTRASEHDRAELIQMYDAGVPWEVMLVSYHQKRGSKEFHTPIKSLDNRRRSMKPSWLNGMSPRERGVVVDRFKVLKLNMFVTSCLTESWIAVLWSP